MKKKITILILLITLLCSCKDYLDFIKDGQKGFVFYLIMRPEDVFTTISSWNESKKYPTESSKNFVNQDTLSQFIEPLRTLKKGSGYYLEYKDPWMYRDSITRKVYFSNEIIAKSIWSNLYMSFYFKTERNQINLVKIDVNNYAYNKIKRDLSLIDTIKKENEDFLRFLLKNPDDFLKNIKEHNKYIDNELDKLSDDFVNRYQKYIRKLSEEGYSIYKRKNNFSSGQIEPGSGFGISDYIVVKSNKNDLYISFWFHPYNDHQSVVRFVKDKRFYDEYHTASFPLDAHPNE